MATYSENFSSENNFTRKEESDKIKSNKNSYPTLSNQTPKLSSEQQKNINSSYKVNSI